MLCTVLGQNTVIKRAHAEKHKDMYESRAQRKFKSTDNVFFNLARPSGIILCWLHRWLDISLQINLHSYNFQHNIGNV